jgi:hypothetical protein
MKYPTSLFLWPALAGLLMLLAACGGSPPAPGPTASASGIEPTVAEQATATPDGEEYRLVTVLPRDAIAAVDDPQFYGVLGADLEYGAQERVMGVVFGGEARAYSVDLLAQREIANDTVAGQPIAVTY